MKICYFGIYNPEYSRNKILISGLRANKVEVLECRSDKKGILKYLDLIKKHFSVRNNYDVMIVGFPGHQIMLLARFLTKKPIIFDAFVSMYDSMVFDRQLVSGSSLKARYYWWLDKISMTLADLVLFDTNEHIKYVSGEFDINSNKFRRIFLGADTEVFYPRKNSISNDFFRVLFFGTYIPLQGVEYIIEAAKILSLEKDIKFELIGSGQEKEKIVSLSKDYNLKNINFLPNIHIDQLAEEISNADICLGIFGNTEKTKRVIPNKVYECLAINKPVITADTSAERELFSDEDVFFVEIANSKAISDAIIKLKNNKFLANTMAENGYKKIKDNCTSRILAKQLIREINEL